jgi:hypothetical protein
VLTLDSLVVANGEQPDNARRSRPRDRVWFELRIDSLYGS